MYKRQVVAVAANPNKAPMFSIEKRVEMARRVVQDLPNVEVRGYAPVSYTHLRAHETVLDLVCRLLLEKKNQSTKSHCYRYHTILPSYFSIPSTMI